MPRYSAGGRTTGAGSTTLPAAGLVPGANNDIYVVEIGVFNTTVTACNVAVRRITSAGTAGSTFTSVPYDEAGGTSASTAALKDTYTSTGPTITAGSVRWATLGAAAGSGLIFTFGGRGLRVPKGTANGLVVIPGVGTGQSLDIYFDWDE
jgi:hypothetical protein